MKVIIRSIEAKNIKLENCPNSDYRRVEIDNIYHFNCDLEFATYLEEDQFFDNLDRRSDPNDLKEIEELTMKIEELESIIEKLRNE